MIELLNNQLTFRFPSAHKQALCHIDFQRTLRIPDDNRAYPLPPGLGDFPLEHVDDFADQLPESWRQHGGASRLHPRVEVEVVGRRVVARLLGMQRADTHPLQVPIGARSAASALHGELQGGLQVGRQKDALAVP